jgi:hypothetical protein
VLAADLGDPSYRIIKGILAAGTERQPATRAAGNGGAGAPAPPGQAVRRRRPSEPAVHDLHHVRHTHVQPRPEIVTASSSCLIVTGVTNAGLGERCAR